ncbi:MAG: acetyl-CoA carboxylase biotin carboxyl carrier protein subunit [Actinomycetota bacterium]|nr:acetyl-CoA carboxylase biotin carboxyl carrier protein subunit [Actinomycetota bacterium]MDA8208240.1 acetyl-CoA carboxylase biotin carboxyl carrier protein subunit [Actinomycetota bacterium]
MQIKSPMSGTLVTFSIAIGNRVQEGQQVAVIESMKMEIPVEADASGEVAALHAAPGDFIEEGDPLISLA